MTIKHLLLAFFCLTAMHAIAINNYLSPTRMSLRPQTEQLWVVLSTDSSLVSLNLPNNQLNTPLRLGFVPSDLSFSPDGMTLYVTENHAHGKLHLIPVEGNKRTKASTIPVGAYPAALCVSHDGKYAWVTNRFSNDLSCIDLSKKKETKRIPLTREPRSLALSPDGRWLVVGNFLPHQSSLDTLVSSTISIIDTQKNTLHKEISLPDGSHSLHDVCFSADGKYLYASHVLSRYHFPTTQLERGWMNTNALTLLSMEEMAHYNTLLLDNVDRGAANPCGLFLAADHKLHVALSGTHEVMTLSLESLHEKLEQLRLTNNDQFNDLSNNLNILQPYKKRYLLTGKSPRYIVGHKNKLYVSHYFSGGVEIITPNEPFKKGSLIVLGNEPAPDVVRKGELYFSDAALCFQQWQSCVSCHPDVRTDGLNWDLMNDGMGNPKNSKSLLFAHKTPPNMITGIRENAEVAVRAGIKHIQFANRPEEEAAAIDEYLKQLRPLPSPYLQNGELTEKAKRGESIFQRVGCIECHSGPYYTDLKPYDVGSGEAEYTNYAFDTPTLREVWRTAPYLYNGKARTLREVLIDYNPDGKHNSVTQLTEKEYKELEEYILSL